MDDGCSNGRWQSNLWLGFTRGTHYAGKKILKKGEGVLSHNSAIESTSYYAPRNMSLVKMRNRTSDVTHIAVILNKQIVQICSLLQC